MLFRSLPNRVAQVGDWRAERKPMQDWVAGLVLPLDAQRHRSLFGDTTSVTIPCYTVEDGVATASPSSTFTTTSKE